MMTIESKHVKYLVIHCSDTPDNENMKAIDIHKMHLNFGWDGIGYQKVICRNGIIENGRPEYWKGAHVYGFNEVSLGVCLIGRNFFTELQFISLKKILLNWKTKYPRSKVLGHYELGETKKTCPNFNVRDWCAKENL